MAKAIKKALSSSQLGVQTFLICNVFSFQILDLLVSGRNSKQEVKVSFPLLPPQTMAAFFVNCPVRPSARASNPTPSVQTFL